MMCSPEPAGTLNRSFDGMNSKREPADGSDLPASPLPSSSSYSKEFNPRSYQWKVFKVAKRRNTIAVLDTGTGKTMIALMLIRELGQAMKANGRKFSIIFLAPTVHLVNQQFKVIKDGTDFEVEEYYGAKGVDEWSAKSWENEISKYDVLVMTPQILLDALRKAFLSLEMVSLMIVDECHRATGNHPYTKIMKEFYHKSVNKPKIFGMTASPVIRKGVSSSVDCENQISELESILDCQIYAIEDRTEVEVFIPAAKEINRFYDASQFDNLDLKAKLKSSLSKFDDVLLNLRVSPMTQYKDMDDKLKALQKRLCNDHAKILSCLDDLGLVCAYEAVKVCIENVSNAQEEFEFYAQSFSQYKFFLQEVLGIIGEYLPHGDVNFLDSESDILKAVDMGYITPKLHELLLVFQSLGVAREVLCLIFVERIITAKVIERFLKKIMYLSHFTVSYLTGSNSSVDALAPKVQRNTLELFRNGKVNLLFATDVVEEGIHVPNCSCVIRFDLPRTVRSYVQSRGRARQIDSQFIIMLERGNTNQRNQLFDIIRSEYSMTDTTTNRDPDECTWKSYTIKEMNAYFVESTGASVTADSSVNLIHRYCEKLPGDKYFTPKPFFHFTYLEGMYECKLTLPPNAAFQTIIGPQSKNSHLSKQLVCLEACKKLHEIGALDDHLLPYVEKPSKNEIIVKCKGSANGAGTTKRKELHGTTQTRALSGTWGDKLDRAIFHAYKIDFSCNIVDELYSGFVLLIESKLDDDVGDIEIELYLISKFVKASVSSCGQVCLDAGQVVKAMRFHELFFNSLFGRLFIGSKSSGVRREFLLNAEQRSLWSSSNLYFLLPIQLSNTPNDESWRINWPGIDSCASAVEFLEKRLKLNAGNMNYNMENSSPCSTGLVEEEHKSISIIHFANKSVDVNNLKNMVVLAIHTGRIYSIIDVMVDKSAESPFDGNVDVNSSNYTTFAEYFSDKYAIVLKYPGQPLLLLKQSHNAHNLLVNFNDEGDFLGHDALHTNQKPLNKKAQVHIHMPPELLLSIELPITVLKSSYLLPSLMHRLESLMLASQLREEIACTAGSQISSSLILEAITTLRCAESFSMERLELLGDSVLKYAVSCHLFLKYPKKHEGQLSARRSLAVCNATLHELGTARSLQGYIRDGAFDPRRWVAPGQRSIRPVPCSCGVDTLEVPLDTNFHTEDTKIVVGKSCDRGHRWMGSKTIADCVEALIGAYYVGGGLNAALQLMKWFGIDVEVEPSLVDEAIATAYLRTYIPKADEIKTLEAKIGYEFSVKGLLLEAITHATEQEHGVGYCYQRLEFLGDSALDVLITWHLYQNFRDIDPGELTDLRSASVNNESFAQAAVRQNLQQHLQHCSGFLLGQIKEYVKHLSDSDDAPNGLHRLKGPKALGDLVESIAGAILIDTRLNLNEVWRIFEPLLSPIVTPDKLELPPLRELNELCDSLGYFTKIKCMNNGELVHAEIRLQLIDALLVGEGCGRSKRAAKGQAAAQLLKNLEKRGISYSRNASKRRKPGADLGDDAYGQSNNEDSLELIKSHKRQKTTGTLAMQSCTSISLSSNCLVDACKPKLDDTPVIKSINMKKGGPRSSLYELCKRLQWPMPSFDTKELRSRSPIIFDEGSERREGFNSFISSISLHIPNCGVVECSGDHRADKKSSLDSAALVMLHQLQQQGKLIIGDS